jgi:hypothetical protein
MNKGLAPIAIILIIAGVLIVAGGIYWWQKAKTTSENNPSIALLSPNGGEVWETGSTHAINWATKSIPSDYKISVTIRRIPPPALPTEGQEFDPIIFINLENNGREDWTISDMYPEGNYIIGITAYKSVPVTNPISDESDASFRIVKLTSNNTANGSTALTTSWKTFNNPNGKYNFKYSPEWNAAINKYNIKNSLFGPDASQESGIAGVEVNQYSGSLDEFINFMQNNADIRYSSVQAMTINGLEAKKVQYSGSASSGSAVLIKSNNEIINIYIASKNSVDLKNFDLLISTFKTISL